MWAKGYTCKVSSLADSTAQYMAPTPSALAARDMTVDPILRVDDRMCGSTPASPSHRCPSTEE